MLIIKKEVIFKIIQFVIFAFLGTVSVILTWEDILKYESSDSGFKRSEVLITNKPTITICFSPPNSNLTYGRDFNFTIYFLYKDYMNKNGNVLKVGENQLQYMVILSKMLTIYNGLCYKTTSITNYTINSEIEVISVGFDESIPIDDVPVTQIHITSETNSYGMTRAQWFDGDVSFFQLKSQQQYIDIGLREQRYQFLKNKLKCRMQPFYDCYGSLIVEGSVGKCPQKCLPHSIPKASDPNATIKYCDMDSEDMKCMTKEAYDIIHGATSSGKCIERACEITQYTGKVVYEETSIRALHTRSFGYYFLPPQSVIIQEEYLIYDFAGMLGTIGGTLGMCIGFSFVGLVSMLLQYFDSFLDCFKIGKNSIENRKSNPKLTMVKSSDNGFVQVKSKRMKMEEVSAFINDSVSKCSKKL